MSPHGISSKDQQHDHTTYQKWNDVIHVITYSHLHTKSTANQQNRGLKELTEKKRKKKPFDQNELFP